MGGKLLHLTFCFLHRVSDNINSLLLASKIVALAEIILFLSAANPQAFLAVFSWSSLKWVQVSQTQQGWESMDQFPLLN